eukprot:TRINITY_DN5244_c0_g2_i1.p1 TRINITY_DN5244_c0_g2~~TRINITY_DN5244_c0_g2_i1.p1  ORF type:complete len:302 (+),score=59.66 TRINITY_DN5244_c0_g2_i1:61-966(+)
MRATRRMLREALTGQIVETTSKEMLLTLLEGKKNLSKMEYVAAVNQCGVFGDRECLRTVVTTWGLASMDNNMYKSMLRSSVQCGDMQEAKQYFTCVENPNGADYGAAMMAAAGLGDAQWGDSLMKSLHERFSLYNETEDDASSTEVLFRHYLACHLRGRSSKRKLDSIFDLALQKGVVLMPDALTMLLFASTSVSHLKFIWTRFPLPLSSRCEHHFSTYSWELLTNGSPSACISHYLTVPSSLRNIPLHCSVVEAGLTLLFAGKDKTDIDMPTIIEALKAAEQSEEGVSEEWARVARERFL